MVVVVVVVVVAVVVGGGAVVDVVVEGVVVVGGIVVFDVVEDDNENVREEFALRYRLLPANVIVIRQVPELLVLSIVDVMVHEPDTFQVFFPLELVDTRVDSL